MYVLFIIAIISVRIPASEDIRRVYTVCVCVCTYVYLQMKYLDVCMYTRLMVRAIKRRRFFYYVVHVYTAATTRAHTNACTGYNFLFFSHTDVIHARTHARIPGNANRGCCRQIGDFPGIVIASF